MYRVFFPYSCFTSPLQCSSIRLAAELIEQYGSGYVEVPSDGVLWRFSAGVWKMERV